MRREKPAITAAALAAIFALISGCASTWSNDPTQVQRVADADAPCRQPSAPFDLAANNAAPAAALVVDDKRIADLLEKEATALIEGKKTTKAADLIEQLKTDKCKLDLPAAGGAAPESQYAQQRPGVLVVTGIFKCNKCSRWHTAPASGFALTAGGVIVTNYHVVNDASRETLIAMTDAGKIFPVKKVLAASLADDLAILQLDLPEKEKLTPLPLGSDAAVGSGVTVISNPDRRFFSLTRGYISRYQRVHHPQKGDTTMLTITADFARGSSGAPLLNDRGEVVGIVASTQSVYYNTDNGKQENLQMVFKQCVPVSSLRKLIEAGK